MRHPMPNDLLRHRAPRVLYQIKNHGAAQYVVVASCTYREAARAEGGNEYTILCLAQTIPFFVVMVVADRFPHWEIQEIETFVNIVPAVEYYRQWGGDY